jgi:lipopolysaccharide biosynthesis regulator YciM
MGHQDTHVGDADGNNRIGDTTIIPRSELEQTAKDEYGFRYRCPRCGYDYVTEYCDCPECLWAGMCQVGWA